MLFLSVSPALELWGTSILSALAISVDSFCASATDAVELPQKRKWLWLFLISLIFGVFHFFMPLIGYSIGRPFIEAVRPYVRWISFGILTFIGLKGFFDIILDKHVDRMDRLAGKYSFQAESHIRELAARDGEVRRIRAILKRQAREFKSGQIPADWCGEGDLNSPQSLHDMGIYLRHLSRWLNRKKLKEILHAPDSKSAERVGRLKLVGVVLIQAFATSLDALILGFTYVGMPEVSGYGTVLPIFALFTLVVTLMSFTGGILGKLLGERSQTVANILGSLVLIGIGIKALF